MSEDPIQLSKTLPGSMTRQNGNRGASTSTVDNNFEEWRKFEVSKARGIDLSSIIDSDFPVQMSLLPSESDSIREIYAHIKDTDDPAIWALAIASITNITSRETLETYKAAAEFSQKEAAAIRQQIMDSNSELSIKMNQLINKYGAAYRSGLNPSGQISPTPKKRKWWQILIAFIVVAVALLIPILGAILITAALGISIVVAALQLVIRSLQAANKSAGTLERIVEVIQELNVVHAFVDVIFDTIEYFKEKSGKLTNKALRKLEADRTITQAVAEILFAIGSAIAIAVATYGSGGPAAVAYAGARIAMLVADIVSAAVQLANGVLDIVAGVKALEAADIKYKVDMLRNVIESLQAFLKTVQDKIDMIIQHMQAIVDDMNFYWTSISDTVKDLGNTKLNIARSITI